MAGKKKSRPLLTGFVVLGLVATSGYLTLELRKQEEKGVTEVRNVGVLTGVQGQATKAGKTSGEWWTRLE